MEIKSKFTQVSNWVVVDNGLALSRVQKDSPAWNVGIGAGDQLVAVNGLKVTSKGFQKRLDDFNTGDVVEMTLFQDDQLNTVNVKLGEKAKGKYSIKSVESPTEQQKIFLKKWLGIEWPFDENGKFIK